jgi:FAD synthetase
MSSKIKIVISLFIADNNHSLAKKIEHSASIIKKIFFEYKFQEIGLAFNGGKDSVVLLHLIHLVMIDLWESGFLTTSVNSVPKCNDIHNSKCYQNSTNEKQNIKVPQTLRIDSEHNLRLKTIYFQFQNSFREITDFMEQAAHIYNLDVTILQCSFKEGLWELKRSTPLKVIFMGTRRSDPHGERLDYLTPTDEGWPEFLRVCPILDWTYGDVWKFIKKLNLPYCVLYDQGYTSIGQTTDTNPNPALKRGNKYLPAYELQDETQERAGRVLNESR